MQHVLIIDDSQAIHALVRARLANESIELHSALQGTDGLRSALENPPDLILLDVDLPDLDGFEICRRLKSSATTMNVPVIFLTGATSSEEKIQGLDMGAVDYITKPFDPAELRARVRSSLRTKYLMDLLSRKAMIDGLTGLWNRGFFDRRLTEERSLSQRTRRPMACILGDIDHFKTCNDRFGHQFGDEVLRQVSAAMSGVVRTEDIVCRYGGEEIAVILPNSTTTGAMELAERLRSAIAGLAFSPKNTPFNVTASFGVASSDSIPLSELVEHADNALYRAKTGGRNRIECAHAGTIASASISRST